MGKSCGVKNQLYIFPAFYFRSARAINSTTVQVKAILFPVLLLSYSIFYNIITKLHIMDKSINVVIFSLRLDFFLRSITKLDTT